MMTTAKIFYTDVSFMIYYNNIEDTMWIISKKYILHCLNYLLNIKTYIYAYIVVIFAISNIHASSVDISNHERNSTHNTLSAHELCLTKNENTILGHSKRSSKNTNTILNDNDIPFTSDSRIRTYIYSPNNIYYIKLHFGFQSQIEFHPGEQIETISLGSPYSVKITPLDNRIFIKPLEQHMRTNMTVITNYRSYQFDIVSKTLEEDDENDLVYLVRFIYLKKKKRVRL